MSLESWQGVVGVSATVSTVLQFLSGVPVCVVFYQRKTTAESSCLSFLAGVCMSCVCYNYGVLIHNTTLQTVNTAGLILQTIYTAVFYTYCSHRTRTGRMLGLAAVFVLSVQAYVLSEDDISLARTRVGLLGALLSITYSSAPLATLPTVFKTRNTETLPYYLILATVLATAQWSLYGVIIEDNIIKIPNLVGFIAAVLQLSLFCCFSSNKSVKTIV